MTEPDTKPPRARWSRLFPSRQRLIELAVVVFGVLVALWLENTVQEWRWHKETQELDLQVRSDMEENLVQAIERISLDPCLRDRIAFLAEGLSGDAAAYAPQPQQLRVRSSTGFGVPSPYLSPLRPWRTASMERLVGAEASKRFPRQRLTAYARTLTTIASIGREQIAENDASGPLAPLALGIPELTPEVRVTLLSNLGELDIARANIELVSRRLVERGEDLRIAPNSEKVRGILNSNREDWGACVDVSKGMALSRRLTDAAERGGR